MQTVMRAIVLQGENQRAPHDASGESVSRSRRQLVVQEDVAMRNEGILGRSEALTTHRTIQRDEHSREIVEYVNDSVATTERRLGGLPQEVVSASQSEFQATIVEHTDRRTNEIECRLQQMLVDAHAKHEAATKSALDQQESNVGAQISAGVNRTEANIQDLFQLNKDNERHLHATLERCENIAATSAQTLAEKHAASIEERLHQSIRGAVEGHATALDSKLQEAIQSIRSDAETRASVWADVNGENIEERLQLKLDAAVEASRKDCREFVNTSLKDVATTINRGLEAVMQSVESKQVAQANCVETRMQQMLLEAQIASQTSLAAMEQTARNAELRSQKRHDEVNSRMNSMILDLEQQITAAGALNEDQWKQIAILSDEKVSSSKQATAISSSTESLFCTKAHMQHRRTSPKQRESSLKREGNPQKDLKAISKLAKAREEAIRATCARIKELSTNLKRSAKLRVQASSK